MKVVILAGGLGTRLGEETMIRPKPLVEIGQKPVLWHIMMIYSYYGFNDFVILLGYKGYQIKEYFVNYLVHNNDVSIDLTNNKIRYLSPDLPPWNVTLLDTGPETQTGGRMLRAMEHLKDEPFMLTYGDGVADINIPELLDFHKSHGQIITMTAVQPEGRFGSVVFTEEGRITEFMEKPKGDKAWINGGFYVCQPGIFDYLQHGDQTIFERQPLEAVARDSRFFAYKHHGFWQCMDTQRDKDLLNDLWKSGKAPWKIWKE